MLEQNTGMILSDNPDFIKQYTEFLNENKFSVLNCGLSEIWEKIQVNNNVDCFVTDNLNGQFPMEDFSAHLLQIRSNSFILNVGQEISADINTPYLIFQIDPQGCLGIKTFLKNSARLLKQTKSQMEMASMLLHDTRSPLNSLIGYLELLINETFGKLNEGQKNILEKSMDLGDATLDMLEELNEIFRGEQTNIILQKQPFNFESILDDVLVNVWVKADRKNIKIRKEIEPNLAKISADDYHIQRVLNNLLVNAIKFSPPNSQVQITAKSRPDHFAEICISDNGKGVPQDKLSILFDKYYRIKQKSSAKKGYGLGLYICKIILKLHNCKIWAENNESGGLSIKFTLPFAGE